MNEAEIMAAAKAEWKTLNRATWPDTETHWQFFLMGYASGFQRSSIFFTDVVIKLRRLLDEVRAHV